MPSGCRDAVANPLDHVLWHKVAISQPQLVVVAQGQRPAPPHIGFAEVVEETHEVGGLAIGHGCKQMGREGEVEGGM